MDSTEQEEDSGMDDILDSIRKIISEDPPDEDLPRTSADQPEVEEARPAANSTRDEENITLQLANPNHLWRTLSTAPEHGCISAAGSP